MNIKIITSIIALSLLATTYSVAQTDSTNGKQRVEIGSHGIVYLSDSSKKDDNLKFGFLALDIGFNSLRDKTDYASAEAQAFMHVPADQQNENLFNLRNGKSINVNLYPMLVGLRIVNTARQKVYLGSGVGFQFYNFRFSKQVTYTDDPTAAVYLDSTAHLIKNKLGMTFLSVPLNLTFKTKVGKQWIVYGAGVTGGYRIASWMKQKSFERGKQKRHDSYNFSDFNACITAEVGIDDIIRLYGSYQVTALHDNALKQYPLSFGLRLGGI